MEYLKINVSHTPEIKYVVYSKIKIKKIFSRNENNKKIRICNELKQKKNPQFQLREWRKISDELNGKPM